MDDSLLEGESNALTTFENAKALALAACRVNPTGCNYAATVAAWQVAEDNHDPEIDGTGIDRGTQAVSLCASYGGGEITCESATPQEIVTWMCGNEYTTTFVAGSCGGTPEEALDNFGWDTDLSNGHTWSFNGRPLGDVGYVPPLGFATPHHTTQQYHPSSPCLNALTVMQAHVTANDNGCRPPQCDFGRATDGWCLPPSNTTPPIIYISGEDVDEDAGTATFRLALSHVSSETIGVTVSTSDGTATAGSDYGATNRRVTFMPKTSSSVVSVPIIDDTTDEADETFTLTMSSPSSNAELSTSPQAEASIHDNDDPQFLGSVTNLNGVCVSGQITVSWGPPAGGNSVNDYRYGIYRDRNYVYRVAGGTTTETQITVDVTDTTLTYYAEVQARGGQNPNQASWLPTGGFTCTVSTPVVSLADTSLSVGENSSVQITATLDVVPSSTASVRFYLPRATNGNGSCTAGADFYVSDTEFTFTNTTSASVTLHACDDTDTDDETVTLTLTATGISGLQLGSPTRVVVTITDDDTAQTPVVSLTSTTLTVDEMQSIQVTASLDMVPSSTASVRFNLSGATNGNGSCSAGAGFYVSETKFTFANTTSASITLYACDDSDTDDETVTLSLTATGISGLELGSPTRVVVTITDDDTAQTPVVSLTSTMLAVDEMQSIQVTASLDMVPSNTASVRFTLSGATNGNGSCSAAGADFYVSDTEFTFTNATSASVTFHACDDTDTSNETVILALTTLGITELQLGSSTTVAVTITDDDTSSAPLLK